MKNGEKILQVFQWYLTQLKKIFDLLDSFELFPGISYLDVILALIIIPILIKIITFGIKHRNMIDEVDPYVGRHSAEYVSKHSKTGLKIRGRK